MKMVKILLLVIVLALTSFIGVSPASAEVYDIQTVPNTVAGFVMCVDQGGGFQARPGDATAICIFNA